MRASIQGEPVRAHGRSAPTTTSLGWPNCWKCRLGDYKHLGRLTAEQPTAGQRRRDLEVKIAAHQEASGGTYESPRITADLHDEGERVSANTVAAIMAELVSKI